MMRALRVAERAAALRRDFDRAFAVPIHPDSVAREELLAVRVGGEPYAIRLSEIAGLHADKTVTPVPGGAAALRGIAGFRGALLPVYDLHVLLGHPGAQTLRWLVVAAAAPVAFAFEAFDGQLRVSRDAVLPQAERADPGRFVRDIVRTATFTGPVMHLPSILDAVKAPRTGTAAI